MKIKNIEMFTDDVMEIINKQEFIGLRLSGGIDSATLCYITMKYFPHLKIVPITLFNKMRPRAAISVEKVISQLKILNPNSELLPREIGYFDTSGYKRNPNSKVKTHPKDVLHKEFDRYLYDKYEGKLNFIMSGETLNPPISEQQKLMVGTENTFPKDRNQTGETLLKGSYKGILRYEYKPFRNYNKKQVAEVVQELGLMSTLFPYTETCETEPHKYRDYYARTFEIEYVDPDNEPCQGCWPCREKYWAYGVFDFNIPLKSRRI